jgi:hypothetical protein
MAPRFLLAALILSALHSPCRADITPTVDSASVDTLIPVDTTLFLPGNFLDRYTKATDSRNFEKRLVQNPTVALFKSMVLPGLGQWGNHSYTKAVVYFGLDAWFVGAAIHYGRQASDFRSKYEASTIITQRNDYYSLYEDRKDERNKFTWFAVIVTFVSMFDAYADAHLSGFPLKDKQNELGFEVGPNVTADLAAQITLRF